MLTNLALPVPRQVGALGTVTTPFGLRHGPLFQVFGGPRTRHWIGLFDLLTIAVLVMLSARSWRCGKSRGSAQLRSLWHLPVGRDATGRRYYRHTACGGSVGSPARPTNSCRPARP